MKHIPSLLMVLFLLMPLASVRAAIIYDESVDGDASPADLGVLGLGTHRVQGNLREVGGALLPDDPILLTMDISDTFQFEIGVGTKLDSILLNFSPLSLRLDIVELDDFLDDTVTAVSPGADVLWELYDLNFVSAGQYTLDVSLESSGGTFDYPYELEFQVSSTGTAIPEPSTLAIFSGMSVGLCGYEFWRRRRSFSTPSRTERRR